MFINYEHENYIYNVTTQRHNNFFYITYDNTEYKVEAEEIRPGQLKIKIGDRIIKAIITEGKTEKYVFAEGNVYKIKQVELTGRRKPKKEEKGDLTSPISGKVVKVKVKKSDIVKKGDILMIIEAMKMEYLIRAPYSGSVTKVNFKENDQIEIGENTLELEKK